MYIQVHTYAPLSQDVDLTNAGDLVLEVSSFPLLNAYVNTLEGLPICITHTEIFHAHMMNLPVHSL